MTRELKKDIAKLAKIPHPRGRKTAKLTRKATRIEHRQKTKHAQTMRTNINAEKYLFFKQQLETNEHCRPSHVFQAIETYLSRFDEEVQQINLKREIGGKRGRQHASREDVIKMTIANETEEFNTCGIELPDVLNPKQFQLLKSWSGELRFLQNFKLTRFNRVKLMNLIGREDSKSMDAQSADSALTDDAPIGVSTTLDNSSNKNCVSDNQPIMECN